MAQPLRFQHFEVLTRPDGTPHVLGKGAMGLTYKAFDRNLLSLAVIKVIAPQLMSNEPARHRFLQEAQTMAKVKHPCVADVFHLGDSAQGVFYAMEFCDGPSLQEYVESHGAIPPATAFALCLQAAQALQAVENHNFIHRDIKPSNILLVNDAQGRSQIKLIDFGLARDVLRSERDPNLSQGGFVGTPTFASPEQLLEQEGLDVRSDIYSLGITLWFMLTGRPPFTGSQFEVMFHHVNTPPPWDRLPALAEAPLTVLRKMIEKSPDERFATSGELVKALQRVVDAEGGPAADPRLELGAREVAGSVLGMSSFEILAECDSDLTGKIFRARDAHSGQVVALKYLNPDIASKPAVLGKIQRHVLSLRSLEHPHLVGVLDFEKGEDGAKIITEWVRGPSLLALLKARNQLTLKEAAPLLGQLASALDFAAAKGLGTVETELHQIHLTSPAWGEEAAGWSKCLRQPVEAWQEVTLKVNPLRLSPAAQDYPSIGTTPVPDASIGGPKPLLTAFLHLLHRLLGGAGGSQASSTGGYVSIPGLGAEANDLLESFFLPPFTPEKRDTPCAAVLRSVCAAEGVAEPEIHEPEPEEELDLLMTRDASVGALDAPPPDEPWTAPEPAPFPQPLPARYPTGGGSRGGSRFGSQARFASQARLGSQVRGGSSAGGSSSGRISADYEIKRRELDLQRQRLEAEAERLKQAEVLEATRAMLEEERAALTEAKDEFARKERERAQRAEQERRKLEEERTRLEEKTREVEAKRREQERLEQEMQLRAQLEFQKFEEERRRREAEWARQREEMERSLAEREEQSFVREQTTFRKLREERERLQKLQGEFESGKAMTQQQAEAALREQMARLEAERDALTARQAELERRMLAQDQEFARLREQFDAAEREIEARHLRLGEEEAAAAARREAALEAERSRLADERAQLEQQRTTLATEQKMGAEATALLFQQREGNEQALARLAAEESRLSAEREALAAQVAEREARLKDDLARARAELEAERQALAAEAERAKERSLADLHAEREALMAAREQAADRERQLTAEVQEKSRALEAQIASQRAQLEAERADFARQRAEIDAEQRRLTDEFAREKEAFTREVDSRRREDDAAHAELMRRRADELRALEDEQQRRLTALQAEISAEESRLQEQKAQVFSQERLITRMDQEASYQSEESLEQIEAEQKRLEAQRSELDAKLEQLHRAQKKRLVTLVAGTIIGVVAASVAGYYIKGRLLDPSKLKGQEAWAQFENERKLTVAAQDWPKLLNWSVVTDDRFQNQEKDPVIKAFYREKRGTVLRDAQEAVNGLLAAMEKGTPPTLDDAGMQKLRQNLNTVAAWDGIPKERLLVLAKLDVPNLVKQGNPGAALDRFSTTVAADGAFMPRLQAELALVVQGLLDDFTQDWALDNQAEIFKQLRALPDAAKDAVPRTWLLMHLLKSEEARAGKPDSANFELALRNVNAPRTGEDTHAFFKADPEWAKLLRPQVDRILQTIQRHPEVVPRLETELRDTAEQWQTDVPYMMLAAVPTLTTQKKLNYYQAAEKLTGNPEARARVAGYYVQQANTLLDEGNKAEATRLMDEALPRLREAADGGTAEAMFLLSDIMRQGRLVPKDLDAAISWAGKAREKGHPDAAFALGLCLLERGEDQREPAVLRQAETALQAATAQAGSPNAARAWYFLANTYNLLKDNAALVRALEKGAQFEDPDCLYMLGQCQLAGAPYFPASNLTLARDNVTKAARSGHAGARTWLQENARVWEKSKLPADREWLQKNGDLLRR